MKREKTPITEIHLNPVLEGLNMSQDEFTDLCILLGCDYCDKIRGKLGAIQILCKLIRLAVGLQGCSCILKLVGPYHNRPFCFQ